jgi:1-acyl-sn-glycerol-3-phosphate acyltransferase
MTKLIFFIFLRLKNIINMAKTLEQKLCNRTLGYAFLRNFFVRPEFYLFYRKVDVIGAETVPDSGPIIFAPNHQNALMDALAILCTKNRQPVFVARADIFQKPLIIAALHFLRILPIYRKRDGGNSSDNNQETFDLILKVLHSGQAVGIMPEGVHNEIKRLRMLQKGVFRLAMQAQEKSGNNPMVKIGPV